MSRPHTVFKWHLANWQSINERMHCLSSWFISNCSIETEIQELWNIFKDECHKCLNSFLLKGVYHLIDIHGLTTTLNAFQTGKKIFIIKHVVLSFNQIGKPLKI